MVTLFILYMVVFLYIYCISKGSSLDKGATRYLEVVRSHNVRIGEVQSEGGWISMVLDSSLPQCPPHYASTMYEQQ